MQTVTITVKDELTGRQHKGTFPINNQTEQEIRRAEIKAVNYFADLLKCNPEDITPILSEF